jgi:hypothetical protein
MDTTYVYAVMDDVGFTLSIHKTLKGAKDERDRRRRNGQTVGAYQVELFE